jgi:hypothetical protein
MAVGTANTLPAGSHVATVNIAADIASKAKLEELDELSHNHGFKF